MDRMLCAWIVARRNKRHIVTKKMLLALARKWDSASDTEVFVGRECVWCMGLANVFANRKLYFTRELLATGAGNPLPSPLPSLPPNLPWQPSLQPSLQLESPFLWPSLSMCSSSESNHPARKRGKQSLSLSKAEHVSQ